MTTLPERDDGGIDWEKIRLDGSSWRWCVGDRTYFADQEELPILAVAQTIERCAKVADDVFLRYATQRPQSEFEAGCKHAAEQCLDAIKELEP